MLDGMQTTSFTRGSGGLRTSAFFEVDEPILARVLGEAMGRGADYADLYFEHSYANAITMEDGIISRASQRDGPRRGHPGPRRRPDGLRVQRGPRPGVHARRRRARPRRSRPAAAARRLGRSCAGPTRDLYPVAPAVGDGRRLHEAAAPPAHGGPRPGQDPSIDKVSVRLGRRRRARPHRHQRGRGPDGPPPDVPALRSRSRPSKDGERQSQPLEPRRAPRARLVHGGASRGDGARGRRPRR